MKTLTLIIDHMSRHKLAYLAAAVILFAGAFAYNYRFPNEIIGALRGDIGFTIPATPPAGSLNFGSNLSSTAMISQSNTALGVNTLLNITAVSAEDVRIDQMAFDVVPQGQLKLTNYALVASTYSGTKVLTSGATPVFTNLNYIVKNKYPVRFRLTAWISGAQVGDTVTTSLSATGVTAAVVSSGAPATLMGFPLPPLKLVYMGQGNLKVSTNISISNASYTVTDSNGLTVGIRTGTSTFYDLAAGNYLITPKAVAGYTTPPAQSVTVAAGQTAMVTLTWGAAVSAGTLTARDLTNGALTSEIAVAGTTKNYVSHYQFVATQEAFEIKTLTVINDSAGKFDVPLDTFAVTKIRMEYPDKNRGLQTATVPMIQGMATFANLNPPIYIPASDLNWPTVKFHADVQTSDYGQTLSGQTFRIGIKDNNTSQSGTFNAVGAASGAAISAPVITGGEFVPPHIVRFTKPTVQKSGGLSALLNGPNALYALTVSADPGRGLEIARFKFRVETHFDLLTDTVTNFQLRDKSLGQPFTNQEAVITQNGNYVTVDFVTPRTISAGASKSFVLSGLMQGANVVGDSISTYIVADSGFITSDANGIRNTDANFIWSDKSSTNPAHSDLTLDWTNGYPVRFLPTVPTVLSY